MEGIEILKIIKRNGGRISGSYARGEETPMSDYDFYIPENKWDKLVKDVPKNFDSCICGHIAWRSTDIGMIEASMMFDKQKTDIKVRDIQGIEFKTW